MADCENGARFCRAVREAHAKSWRCGAGPGFARQAHICSAPDRRLFGGPMMPRCTTPVFLVLALSLATTVRAQTAAPAPAGAPGEPTLERRSVSGAAPRATISGAAEP